jgi:hypothetical protein
MATGAIALERPRMLAQHPGDGRKDTSEYSSSHAMRLRS